MTGRQLALGEEFRRAGLLAVLGIGSAPGKTNLMAAKAVAQLVGDGERRVDALHVAAAGRDLSPPDGESFPYALQTLLDEVTMAPVAIEDGEPIELEALSGGGEIDFGEPIGVAPAINTLHSEMLTFPPSFGCAEASFKLSLSHTVEERLRELAGAERAEIERVVAAARPPSAETVSVHVVDARLGSAALRVRSVTPPHHGWGLGGGIVSTATPIAAAVRLLARGDLSATGTHPPERCIDPDLMFAELENRGVSFEITTAEEAAA
jgi:saccharopine dehydrogenase-like NADP-dependent oxidoreductase